MDTAVVFESVAVVESTTLIASGDTNSRPTESVEVVASVALVRRTSSTPTESDEVVVSEVTEYVPTTEPTTSEDVVASTVGTRNPIPTLSDWLAVSAFRVVLAMTTESEAELVSAFALSQRVANRIDAAKRKGAETVAGRTRTHDTESVELVPSLTATEDGDSTTTEFESDADVVSVVADVVIENAPTSETVTVPPDAVRRIVWVPAPRVPVVRVAI